MWCNDIKCKYMFIFPLKNLARKEFWIYYLSKISIFPPSPAEYTKLGPLYIFIE